MKKYDIDPLFRVDLLRATPNPQSVIWWASHNDYSEDYIIEEIEQGKYNHDEKWFGEKTIKNLFGKNKGHFGVCEHPAITIAAGYFPHNVISQLRTHRVGVTFDVQSFRYSGERFVKFYLNFHNMVDPFEEIEKLIYFRPKGIYIDRQGNKYDYTEERRRADKERAICMINDYGFKVYKENCPKEMARGLLPYDYRQHFTFSANLRSAFHILDLRSKADAQLEIRQFCDLFFEVLKNWSPELCSWYEDARLRKAILSP